MKIIHFADTHIGVETYGTIDPASGLSTRVVDELNALDKVIDYAVENSADIVLFCGDAYKNREPSPTHQREFARRMRRLAESNIPTVIVVGNHDLPGSPGKANSVEIFDTLRIDNIHIAARPDVIRIDTKDGEIQIAVFPWLRRNALLTLENFRNLSVSQINEQLQEVLSAKLLELAGSVDCSKPAVLAAHVAVANAKTGTEASMMIGSDPVVTLSTMANPVYDYIALGHVHRSQVLSEAPPVVYSGSLERLDFGDEGQEKGFYVIDIIKEGGEKRTDYRFHTVDARRFITVEIHVTDEEADPTGAILRHLSARAGDIAGSIIRLRISLPGGMPGALREGEIFKALKEAYNVSIAKEIRRSSNVRASGWIINSMAPIEALKKYLDNNNTPRQRRDKLLEFGEKLINEKLSANRGAHAE